MPDINNAVINGVLCYISSARQTYTDQVMLSVCLSYYDSEKISQAKEALYSFSDEACVVRRGDNKNKANIQDIINLYRKLDEDNTPLPKFLADRFDCMPPASGYEVIADHILQLMTEISNLSSEVSVLKATMSSPTSENLNDMKEDIYDIKNILLQQSTESRVQVPVVNTKKVDHPASKELGPKTYAHVSKSPPNAAKHKTSGSDVASGSGVTVNTKSNAKISTAAGKQLDDVSIHGKQGEWQVVNRKNKREVIKGQRKSISTIKAVKQTADLYVGRCDPSVTEEALKNYINNEVNIMIENCECLAGSVDDRRVKSFKVTVSLEDRDKLLSPSVWPENIRVRKYYNNRNNGSIKK